MAAMLDIKTDFAACAPYHGEIKSDLFSSLGWYRLLHHHCFPDYTPLIAEAHIGQGQAHKSLRLFLMRSGIMHGHSLSNWYGFSFRPEISSAMNEQEKLAALSTIAHGLRRSTCQLVMDNIPEEDDWADLIPRAFIHAGWITNVEKMDTNHILHVKGRTFDDYWASRPGQLRTTVRRKKKRYGIATRIETKFDRNSWADYEQIYAKSWKPEEGSPAFLRELAKSESDHGHYRLGLAFYHGEPVAAQFWTIRGNVGYIHKLAHDPEIAMASPGTLLSAAMFQHVIDRDGVELVDFGTGNDHYKKDWMNDSRARFHISAYYPHNPLSWPRLSRLKIKKWLENRQKTMDLQ